MAAFPPLLLLSTVLSVPCIGVLVAFSMDGVGLGWEGLQFLDDNLKILLVVHFLLSTSKNSLNELLGVCDLTVDVEPRPSFLPAQWPESHASVHATSPGIGPFLIFTSYSVPSDM
ncbi:hypothetical protein BJ912DRAFT_135534 [Pholiota molesta]|nr:hypothetical protein BJ912DRAFT_135534 [Pholiota molesta]